MREDESIYYLFVSTENLFLLHIYNSMSVIYYSIFNTAYNDISEIDCYL